MNPTPLRGTSVVITRAEADADELRTQLTALGAVVTVVPSIVLVSRPVDDAMRAAVADLHRTAWVAFASRQGVNSFADLLQELHVTLPQGIRLAVVGPGTAKTCAERLRPANLVASPCNAEGLAQNLVAKGRPEDGPVLLPAAAMGRVLLRDRLREAGFTVNHLILYDTHPATTADGPAPLPARVDYVLFTSPSTVEGFLARSGVPPGAQVVTIGPTTSAAVRARGLSVAYEAREHSLDGIVSTLTEASRHAS